MSSSKGSQELSNLLAKRLVSSGLSRILEENYREKLDTKGVVMDIGPEAFISNLPYLGTTDYWVSYNEFYDTVLKFFSSNPSRLHTNMSEYYSSKSKAEGVRLVLNPPSLLAKDFSAIRRFITENISKKIPSNSLFGSSKRRVYYSEIAETIEAADTSEWILKYRDRVGIPKEWQSVFNKEGYLLDKTGKISEVSRSNVDIGHIAYSSTSTPLAMKLSKVSGSSKFTSTAREAAQQALDKLKYIHGELAFNFTNTSDSVIKAKGRLTLTLHHYKLNNEIAVKEAEIYKTFLKTLYASMSEDLLDISGSNTLKEDILELLGNKILGNNAKLAKHGTASTKNSTKGSVKLTKPTIVKPNISTPPKLRTLQNRSYSLASLQVLLNQHLQHVIAANMGDGGQRSILNYRTGRFAASAKVERLSQSREGMITAFYTYMKNPYQTFEPGFEQGSKTRDPKLLISKSIKEIAATKVGNRMRAVLV